MKHHYNWHIPAPPAAVLLTALWISACVLLPLGTAAAKDREAAATPIEILGKEHDLIQKMAAFTERRAEDILEADAVDHQELKQLHNFFTRFADQCHHAKEESSLFPILMEKRVDPVVVQLLIKQHEEGRVLLGGVKQLLESEALTEEQRAALAEYFLQYSQLMQRHIDLENRYLWPKASRTLNQKTKDELVSQFERIENELGEGFHEKYHALAMKLLNKPT